MTHVYPPTQNEISSLFFSFLALKLQSLLLMGLFGFPFFNTNCCRAWHEHNELLLLKKEPRAFQGFQKLRAKYVFVSFSAIFFFLFKSISSSRSTLHHHKGYEYIFVRGKSLSGICAKGKFIYSGDL